MQMHADSAPSVSNGLTVALAALAGIFCLLVFSFLRLPLAVSVVAVLVFAVAAVFRPAAGLALLAAVLPVEGIAASQLEMTEVRLVGIAAFGIWAAHLVLYRKRIRYDRTFLIGAALVAWAGFSLLWAANMEYAGRQYGTLLQVLLLFLLTLNVVETEGDFRLILAGLLVGALATSHLALSVFVENMIERARAFEAQNPNSYAMVVGTAIIAGIYLMRSVRSYLLKIPLLGATLFLGVPLVLAQSRTAWVATAAALFMVIWHTRHRMRNFLIAGVLAAGLVGALFAFGMVSFTLVHRASDLVTMRSGGSNRLDIWRVAANVIKENPVAGAGYAQFPYAFNKQRPRTTGIRSDQVSMRDPHSVYLGVTAEMGAVGLILLLALFWSAAREERPPPGSRPWISDALVVFIAMFSVGGTIYHTKLFWLALALAAKARHLAVRAEPERSEATR